MRWTSRFPTTLWNVYCCKLYRVGSPWQWHHMSDWALRRLESSSIWLFVYGLVWAYNTTISSIPCLRGTPVAARLRTQWASDECATISWRHHPIHAIHVDRMPINLSDMLPFHIIQWEIFLQIYIVSVAFNYLETLNTSILLNENATVLVLLSKSVTT